MTIDIKYKLTPVAFPELNQRSWHDKLQTPQSQEKKCKNSHTLVGKTAEVWRVGSSAFAPDIFLGIFQLVFFNAATSLTLHGPFKSELILALKTRTISLIPKEEASIRRAGIQRMELRVYFPLQTLYTQHGVAEECIYRVVKGK